MITKNISVIQGENPNGTFSAAKLDNNGYLLTASAIIPSGQPSLVATDQDPIVNPDTLNPYRYTNTVIGPHPLEGVMRSAATMDALQSSSSYIPTDTAKLLVDQGKQFQTIRSFTYDCSSVPQTDISNNIETAINTWKNDHGPRYDDIIITSFTSNDGTGSIKYLVNITIIRYY